MLTGESSDGGLRGLFARALYIRKSTLRIFCVTAAAGSNHPEQQLRLRESQVSASHRRRLPRLVGAPICGQFAGACQYAFAVPGTERCRVHRRLALQRRDERCLVRLKAQPPL